MNNIPINQLVLFIALVSIGSFASSCKSSKIESEQEVEEETNVETPPSSVPLSETDLNKYQQELKIMKKEVLLLGREIIQSTECSNDSSCIAIALGAKPCGGPWEYLIVPKSDKTNELIALIEGYNGFEQEINERFALASDCAFVEPPLLKCNSGKCEEEK